MAVSRLPGVRRQFLSGTDIESDELKIVNVSGISISAAGYQEQNITFTKPFPKACDAVFLQIKELGYRTWPTSAFGYMGDPSGLKAMIWPPKRLQTRTGFQLNIDINVACSLSGFPNMAVEALCFGH